MEKGKHKYSVKGNGIISEEQLKTLKKKTLCEDCKDRVKSSM